MGEYLEETVGDVSLATFLGFWSVMGGYFYKQPLIITHYVISVNALYAYIGIELVRLIFFAA